MRVLPSSPSLAPSRSTLPAPRSLPRRASAFTLVELLIVIAIVIILAGLGFAGVQSAMKQGRKTEVRAMANQIKVAIEAYYAEYGYYPSATSSDANFLNLITGDPAATDNKRGIRFMDLPAKFTNSSGIVTPRGFGSNQITFSISVDTNFSGSIMAPDNTTVNQSVAVGVPDPDRANQWVGTWK